MARRQVKARGNADEERDPLARIAALTGRMRRQGQQRLLATRADRVRDECRCAMLAEILEQIALDPRPVTERVPEYTIRRDNGRVVGIERR